MFLYGSPRADNLGIILIFSQQINQGSIDHPWLAVQQPVYEFCFTYD
jgi:hypothetical protein